MAHRLYPGEQVRVRTRAHPGVLMKPVVWFVVMCAATGMLQGFFSRPDLAPWLADFRQYWLVLGYCLIGLLLFMGSVRPWWRWLNRITYVTTARVMQRVGLVRVQHRWLTLSAVSRFQIRQSRRQRWSRRGDVQLWAYTGQLWTLRNLPEIQRLAGVIDAELYETARTSRYGSDGIEAAWNHPGNS